MSLGDDVPAGGLQNAMDQEWTVRAKGLEKFTWFPKQFVESRLTTIK